ncbi:MAG TPA: CarD family transcriptional regulator [Pyrinomonadaceae bacterium]|nr:CarD family transcriptional regulator [Pyrinomonadaceae bacterium]
MELSIGQKVAYPGQGVCVVEAIERRNIGGQTVGCYLLRVVGDNSHILVPVANAEAVGIRLVISLSQCKKLIKRLADDFDEVSADWKSRSREFTEKLQSGDVFEAADVLKKLTFLSHGKKLSFREQTLLEKAKYLILSEITNTEFATHETLEPRLGALVESACSKHLKTQPYYLTAAAAG